MIPLFGSEEEEEEEEEKGEEKEVVVGIVVVVEVKGVKMIGAEIVVRRGGEEVGREGSGKEVKGGGAEINVEVEEEVTREEEEEEEEEEEVREEKEGGGRDLSVCIFLSLFVISWLIL